jgi:hypothetical protein
MNLDSFVNIEGIDRHQVTNIPVVTCGAYTVTAVILKGPSILSAGQLEVFYNKVNKRSLRCDPKGQLITTDNGFELPLNVLGHAPLHGC